MSTPKEIVIKSVRYYDDQTYAGRPVRNVFIQTPNSEEAQKLAERLKELGIVRHDGSLKRTVDGYGNHGIILTPENIANLKLTSTWAMKPQDSTEMQEKFNLSFLHRFLNLNDPNQPNKLEKALLAAIAGGGEPSAPATHPKAATPVAGPKLETFDNAGFFEFLKDHGLRGKIAPGYHGFSFMMVMPNQPDNFALKSDFKPPETRFMGMFTEGLKKARKVMPSKSKVFGDDPFVAGMMGKEPKKGIFAGGEGDEHSVDDASFKLHISINNLANQDPSIISELASHLVSDSENPNNNISFKFKIAEQNLIKNHARFKNTEQFTIYFDKYSSIGEMLELTGRINKFLQERGLDQPTPLGNPADGAKDTIGFGKFVSGRFETLKLYDSYKVHEEIDKQLDLFFTHFKDNPARLKGVPLCVIEKAVHDAIIQNSDNIDDFNNAMQDNLAEAVANPKAYLAKEVSPRAKPAGPAAGR